MAKNKKTRKEKIVSDNRRQTVATEHTHQSVSYSIPTAASMSSTSSYHVNENQLIVADLRKTFILTLIALAIQIGIYVLMHAGRG